MLDLTTIPLSTTQDIIALSEILPLLGPDELKAIDELTADLPVWMPLPGPQAEAYYTKADILYYGGSAGGSKTDLLLGLGLTAHHRSIIYRRESTQLQGIFDRLTDIRGSRDGFTEQKLIWRLPDLQGRQIEFGHCKDPGDEQKFQGRPHDGLFFDEITHFLEYQFRFLSTWNRSTHPGQRSRIVCAGNPPTDAEGRWVIDYWGPWLDPNHPHPAKPGELRWYTTIKGKDVECENGDKIKVAGKMVKPRSRTFIPSRVTDNPFLMVTDYEATLQALPEPLRSQMLNGDFWAGVTDDAMQVIPSDWVDAAMARWTPEGKEGNSLSAVGADIARGGPDKTTYAPRWNDWFDQITAIPGEKTPDGPSAVGYLLPIIKINPDVAIFVDVIGVGGSVYDITKEDYNVTPINSAEGAPQARDRSGKLKMRNQRAAMWWTMRESLDPDYDSKVCLPPDSELKADLCAPRWKLTGGGVLIESKDDVKKRIGRSTDKGDSVCLTTFGKNTIFGGMDLS